MSREDCTATSSQGRESAAVSFLSHAADSPAALALALSPPHGQTTLLSPTHLAAGHSLTLLVSLAYSLTHSLTSFPLPRESTITPEGSISGCFERALCNRVMCLGVN